MKLNEIAAMTIAAVAALAFAFYGPAVHAKQSGGGKSSASSGNSSGNSSGGGGKSVSTGSKSSGGGGKSSTSSGGDGRSNGSSGNNNSFSNVSSRKSGNTENGTLPELVRDYRSVSKELGPTEKKLAALEQEIAALEATRSDADIDAEINALNRGDAGYQASLKALVAERFRSPSKALLARKIANRKRSAQLLQAKVSRLETARAAAWARLSKGRSPKDAAIEVLKQKYWIE